MRRGVLLLLAVAACRSHASPVDASTLPSPSASSDDVLLPPLPLPTDGTVHVRFMHAGADMWIADYALPEPVGSLAFRLRHVDRDRWHILDPPGATLAGRTVVSARPFDRLRIAIPTDTTQPAEGNRPFTRYTDSGLLAFTGPLAIDDHAGTLTLAPAAGEQVVVRGLAPASEASVPLDARGTVAYFGSLVPVTTAGFTGVLDRGMPGWMRDRVSEDLPRLFAFYGAKLGPLDGPTPTVFLTFGTREHGVSLDGRVFKPHLVTIDLELEPARQTEGSGTRLDIDRLVAHEAAHFWNDDQHLRRDDPGASWLDEGSADAMAARALHATGVLDDAAYRDTLSEAASECALWLSGGEPLASPARPGHARARYVCGSTLSLAAEAAVHRRDPAADLFTFWQAVFDEGKPSYGEATFLHVLDRLGRAPAVTEAVRRLVHERQDDPTQALRDALRLVGIETTVVSQGPLPVEYEQHASIPEMDALLPPACSRALTFDGDVEVRPAVGADGACPGLARGDVIELVAGLPVGSRGASSWQTAFATCRERHTVEVVTAARAHLTLPCEPQAKVAPAYFEVGRVP